jgi:hypothetical protein
MKAFAVIALCALALLSCADDGGPPKPFNLTADNAGGAAVLRWSYNAAPGLDSFLVQRSEGFNDNFADLAKTPANKLDYFDGGVAVGETYYYRVAAVYTEWNGEKNVRSGFSAEVSVQIE